MVIKIAAKDKKLNIMYFTFLIIYKYKLVWLIVPKKIELGYSIRDKLKGKEIFMKKIKVMKRTQLKMKNFLRKKEHCQQQDKFLEDL